MANQQSHEQAVQALLPQSGTIALYVRVASKARLTRQQQIDGLITLAGQLGYSREQIIAYEESGISGKKSIAEREVLRKLLEAVEQHSIKAILVSSEDRLFRDADAIQVSVFMRKCLEYGVQLITPQTTYDFTNPVLVALFRFRCEQSTLSVERTLPQRARKKTSRTSHN